MSSADLFVKINSLPEDVRKQVTDRSEFLIARRPPVKEGGGPPRKKPVAGSLKGKIWIADDLDAPLDDFKEYME